MKIFCYTDYRNIVQLYQHHYPTDICFPTAGAETPKFFYRRFVNNYPTNMVCSNWSTRDPIIHSICRITREKLFLLSSLFPVHQYNHNPHLENLPLQLFFEPFTLILVGPESCPPTETPSEVATFFTPGIVTRILVGISFWQQT